MTIDKTEFISNNFFGIFFSFSRFDQFLTFFFINKKKTISNVHVISRESQTVSHYNIAENMFAYKPVMAIDGHRTTTTQYLGFNYNFVQVFLSFPTIYRVSARIPKWVTTWPFKEKLALEMIALFFILLSKHFLIIRTKRLRSYECTRGTFFLLRKCKKEISVHKMEEIKEKHLQSFSEIKQNRLQPQNEKSMCYIIDKPRNDQP